MGANNVVLTPDVVVKLAERLSQIGNVTQFDLPGEPQSTTLAYSLAELEAQFRQMLDLRLPKLVDPSLTPEQLNDALLDVGEDIRHILYHIKDPAFFGYLQDQGVTL